MGEGSAMVLPDLRFLLAVLWAGALGGAVVLLITGVRGSRVDLSRPPSRWAVWMRRLRAPAVGLRVAGGIGVFAATLVLTRWPVAAAALGAMVMFWPALFGGQQQEQQQTARLEALVAWTEAMRDTMAGNASLEAAIPATVPNSSPLIRPALLQLQGQLAARVPMDTALARLAATLADSSADLVIGALILNVKRRGDRLGEVLSSLALTAREELDMRRKVTAGRAEIRRGFRIIIVITLGFGGYFALFGGDYMKPYSTFGGQIALLVVCGLFVAGFAWMRKLAGSSPAEPLLTRPGMGVSEQELALVASLTDTAATRPVTGPRPILIPTPPAPGAGQSR
jgi:tight adherence protein B